MKYEIEIPNLPEGVRPVGYGLKSKEFALCSDERGNLAVFCAHRPLPHLIRVIPTDGYEFVGRESDFLVTVRRIPSKKVVIELEWTPRIQDHIDTGDIHLDSFAHSKFCVRVPDSAVRVVEE